MRFIFGALVRLGRATLTFASASARAAKLLVYLDSTLGSFPADVSGPPSLLIRHFSICDGREINVTRARVMSSGAPVPEPEWR